MNFILNGKKKSGDANPDLAVLPCLRDVQGTAFDGVSRTTFPLREMRVLEPNPKSKSKSKSKSK